MIIHKCDSVETTFIKETAIAVSLMCSCISLHVCLTNWCGRTKISMSASFVASTTSGTATCKNMVKTGKHLYTIANYIEFHQWTYRNYVDTPPLMT